MYWVEGIKTVLQKFVLCAFFAAIQPNGNQGENGKALGRNLHIYTKQFYWEYLPFKKYNMYQDHCNKLRKPCKWEIPEQVKHHYSQHSPKAVVRKTKYRCDAQQD